MTATSGPRLVLILDQNGSCRQKGNGVFDGIAGFGMLVLLFFGVLAFGAVEEWSAFVLETAAALLFFVWFLGQIRRGKLELSASLYLPAFAFLGIIALQIVLGRTSYQYASRYEALKYLAYGIALLVGSECFRTTKSRRVLAIAISIAGALYATFALLQDLTSNGKIYWAIPLRWGGWIYGSYVNHAHYAGLMELLVPFPLVLAMGQAVHDGRKTLVGFAATLMASTIFLSGSRAGMAAFVFEMAILGILLFRRRGRVVLFACIGLALALTGLIVFLGKGNLTGRLSDMSPETRWQVTRDSMQMVKERPILGWGLGTFPTAYPPFRTFHTNKLVNAAHDDYAQLTVETGIAGFSVLLWFLFVLIRKATFHARDWENTWHSTVALSALVGCSGLLLHGFVDFNLQIPANAAFFYFLCGVATAQPIAAEHAAAWEQEE